MRVNNTNTGVFLINESSQSLLEFLRSCWKCVPKSTSGTAHKHQTKMEYLQHGLPTAYGELVVCAGEQTSFIPVIVISPGGNNGFLCLLNGFTWAVWGQLFQQRRKYQSISNTLIIIHQSAVSIICLYIDHDKPCYVTNHVGFIVQNVTTE